MWKPTVQKSYWHPRPTSDELYHHGILGQKWGQQNGPPYPLNAEDHSDAEKKAGYKKSIGGGKTSSVKKKKTEPVYKEQQKVTDEFNKSVSKKHNIDEMNNSLAKIDSLSTQYNKTGTKTAIGINKRKKIQAQMEEEIKKLDEPFKDPEVQKAMVNRIHGEKDTTDPTSAESFGAYYYLGKRVKNTFGDWYWGEFKSDRAKAAYNNYQKEMLKVDALKEKMRDIENRDVNEDNRKRYSELDKESKVIKIKAKLAITKEAMKDAGFDASVYNDPDMLDKFYDIVFWD